MSYRDRSLPQRLQRVESSPRGRRGAITSKCNTAGIQSSALHPGLADIVTVQHIMCISRGAEPARAAEADISRCRRDVDVYRYIYIYVYTPNRT